MIWKKTLILILAILLTTGCKGKSPDREKQSSGKAFTDVTGAQIRLSSPPRRIVSLSPALTESLYLLGAQDQLAGVTIYCDRPPEARKKTKIGTVISPDIEKIASLSPDLILATKEINKAKTVYKLRSLGLKVFVFDARNSFSDVRKEFLLMGKLLDKENKAINIVEHARIDIDAVKRKVHDKPRIKVFWQMGSDPLVTVAKGTFVDEIIGMAGGNNIAHESKIKYPTYSLEEVVNQNPDVIIIVTMGDITEQAKRTWRAFKNLKAVKNNRIYVLDANSVCSPTPQSFAQGLRKIAGLLHPDEFKK